MCQATKHKYAFNDSWQQPVEFANVNFVALVVEMKSVIKVFVAAEVPFRYCWEFEHRIDVLFCFFNMVSFV